MVRIGIIGFGYWGPNLARTFSKLPDSEVTAICDLKEDRLHHARKQLPKVFTTININDIINKNRIDAVVISTPAKTHYALAKQALENGIHVLAEKPLATSTVECNELIEIAEAKNLILFVGHLFLYHEAVVKLKNLILHGELGNVSYIHSKRLNLGPIRKDVDALWDLATHDVSIILDLIGRSPVAVNCQGLAYLNDKLHDVSSLTLYFEPKCMAIIHVSWIDPNKIRLMTVVGDRKTAVFDDMEPIEKIRIYDKHVETPPYSERFGKFQFDFHYGDTKIPYLKQVEPLATECRHFLNSVINGERPKTDGKNGLEVVRVMEAADISLHQRGRLIEIYHKNDFELLKKIA